MLNRPMDDVSYDYLPTRVHIIDPPGTDKMLHLVTALAYSVLLI